ncbi:hypothetical protein ACXWOY_09305, partial [Streptococcus pyogenes]
FTATIAGLYYFQYQQPVGSSTGEFRIHFRTQAGYQTAGRPIIYKVHSDHYTFHNELKIYLNVGDYIEVFFLSGSGALSSDP